MEHTRQSVELAVYAKGRNLAWADGVCHSRSSSPEVTRNQLRRARISPVYTSVTKRQFTAPFIPIEAIWLMASDLVPSLAPCQASQLDDPLLNREWFAVAWSREI